MRLNRLRRFTLALAIVWLAGGVALASTPGLYVCQGDGVARLECCCPAADHGVPAAPSQGPELSARCCCDISQLEAPLSQGPAMPSVTASVAPDVAAAFVTAIDLDSLVPRGNARSIGALAQAPPRGIPILLGKQSFLI
jgi:hypothetical protein